MAILHWRQKRKTNYSPASYTADETVALFAVDVGDLIYDCLTRTRAIFNGSGTAAKIEIGDGGDPDRFMEDGHMDETALGIYQGKGVGVDNSHLYSAADTIDVVFTANTSGTRTTGAIDVLVLYAAITL
jgi:hypothetical protein